MHGGGGSGQEWRLFVGSIGKRRVADGKHPFNEPKKSHRKFLRWLWPHTLLAI
jgi:hypothetical protein